MIPTQLLHDVLIRYDVESTKQLRSLVTLSISSCETGQPTLMALAKYNRMRLYTKPLTTEEYVNYINILHGIGVVDKNEEVWLPHIKPKFFTDDTY